MTTLLTNLQNKTDAQKGALAVSAAVVITGFLFITWGYNFAHSGKVNNLASSAAGVADAVESANLSENFNTALEQLKSISGLTETEIVPEQVVGAEQDSVGSKHMNVFTSPGASLDTIQKYGENVGDVLY